MTTTEYLQEHSLDSDFVASLGWQWTDEAITIPYYDTNGKLLFCKYRNMVGDKFSFDKGNHPALYASYKIKNEQVVVFCEGEADCARLWQEGIPAVTAGGVTAVNKEIALPLKDKDVIVLLDTDKAGKDAIQKTVTILSEVGAIARIASLPQEYKDICEFFTAGHSSQDFRTVINESLSLEEWEEHNRPEEYSVLSGEMLMQRDFPPQRWLIKRMIPITGITFLVGSEGVGKSFNALTIADSIANGTSWLKTFEVEQKTNVLILDKENSLNETQDRMKALKISGSGLFFLEFPHYFRFEPDTNEKPYSDFSLYIKNFVEKNNIGLIVIDSFVDLMTGNENSSQDTQVFFNTIKQLFTDKSLLILHHAGKSNGLVPRSSSEKTRGSTNIPAQAFSSFFISKIPKEENGFSVEQTKLRGGGKKIKKFKVEMEIHTDVYNKDLSQVIGLRYAGEIEEEEGKELRAEESIIQTLEVQQEMIRSELETIVTLQGISKGTFRKVFDQLKNDKIIGSTPHPSDKRKVMISLI